MSLPMPDYGLTARLLAQSLTQTRPRPYSMAGFVQVHTHIHISIRQESLTNFSFLEIFFFLFYFNCSKINLCVSSSLICFVKITARGFLLTCMIFILNGQFTLLLFSVKRQLSIQPTFTALFVHFKSILASDCILFSLQENRIETLQTKLFHLERYESE